MHKCIMKLKTTTSLLNKNYKINRSKITFNIVSC